MKVFGIDEIVNSRSQKDKIKNKRSPENWSWYPSNPGKIKNIIKVLKREKDHVNYACITNYTPEVETQDIVLIFAMGNLSFGFIESLKKHDIKFVFLDFLQFVARGKVNFNISKGSVKNILQIEDVVINMDDIKIVIWNTPFYPYPIFDFDLFPETNRDKFLHKKRWAQVLKEFRGFLRKEVSWFPGDPFNGSQEWQNKLNEYKIANEEGLHIPPFILTNDLSALKEFGLENGNNLLLREFSTPPYSLSPVKIIIEEVSEDLLKTSPCVFQQYITKKFEFRVIVLLNKVFPCKIYSQDSELAKHDWRVHDDENVKWELVKFPKALERKLVKIAKRLNLTWCSMDIILSTDDKYYFLEANRPGAHYWLDMFVGLDITEEIISELKKML